MEGMADALEGLVHRLLSLSGALGRGAGQGREGGRAQAGSLQSALASTDGRTNSSLRSRKLPAQHIYL